MIDAKATLREKMEAIAAFNLELFAVEKNDVMDEMVINESALPATTTEAIGLLYIDNYAHHFSTLVFNKLTHGNRPLPPKIARKISDSCINTLKANARYAFAILYPAVAAVDRTKMIQEQYWYGKPWICENIRTDTAIKDLGLAIIETLLPVVYGDMNSLSSRVLKPIFDFVVETLMFNFRITDFEQWNPANSELLLDRVPEWAAKITPSGKRVMGNSMPVSAGRLQDGTGGVVSKALRQLESTEDFAQPLSAGTAFAMFDRVFYAHNELTFNEEGGLLSGEMVCLN